MIASLRFLSFAFDNLFVFAVAMRCVFELLISLIFDCDFASVDWRMISVGWTVVAWIVVMAVVFDMFGDVTMEDIDRFRRSETLLLMFIVDTTSTMLFELSVSLFSLTGISNVVATVVVAIVVSANDWFGWTFDAFDSETAYSYFKTDVGFIGIDKFVLCLFSIIGDVSLAGDVSLVTFDKPKCTDCCLLNRTIKSEWEMRNALCVWFSN